MLGSIRGGLQSVRTGSMESPGSGGGGGGTVDSVVAGLNIDVNAADPANPIVSLENVVDIVTLNVSGLATVDDLVVTDDATVGDRLNVLGLLTASAAANIAGAVAMNGVSGGVGLLVGDGVDIYFGVHAGGVFVNDPTNPPAAPKDFFVNNAVAHFDDVTIASSLNSWTNPGSLFNNVISGIVPASGGGAVNFLRADGTWAVPAGGGGGGQVNSVVAGSNIDVDATDPANPIVSLEAVVDITTLNATGNVVAGDTISGVHGNFTDIVAGLANVNDIDCQDLDVSAAATVGGDLAVTGTTTLDFALIDELNVTTSIDCNDLNVVAELVVAGTINGTAAPLTDTLGSNGQNLASTAVISGTGQDYEISGVVVRPNEVVTYTLELNNLATNQQGILFGVDNGSVVFDQTDTSIFIGSAEVDGTTGKTYFRGRIVQMVGQERMIYLEVTTYLASGYVNSYRVTARWNVTTEITAIRIHASTATGLKTGTQLRVAKTLR